MNEVFQGLKVVELATVLAGPTVGMFFAELGADVIKVENPKTDGDITRKWKLRSENPTSEHSAYFCSVNWGKKHVFIDLKTKRGKQQVYELVKKADVIITNFKFGDDEKLGMGPSTLLNLNSALIYAKITGFGDESPRPAFDVVLQAETGYMHMNGQPGTEASKMPVALIDVLAAHQLKEAILIALLKKASTGKGSVVSVSLFEAAISALTNQASNWLIAGHVPEQMGSLHPNIAPYGEIIVSSDNMRIVLAAGTDRQFMELCKVLDIKHLSTDIRFCTAQGRIKHRKALILLLQEKAGELQGSELMDEILKAGVPAGEIRNMKEVFDLEQAKKMIKQEILTDGTVSQCVSDIAFKIC
ncbi:MAG: crotonobetainyl-CoA:carnitine CoA-transferase CaiB-like acyl-CoA transferase [Granulosicoccus sp.]|jgi:crotonobetainyl-CoA:carnitine CoA-transferase CaiB-like acyl-CoA transferase